MLLNEGVCHFRQFAKSKAFFRDFTLFRLFSQLSLEPRVLFGQGLLASRGALLLLLGLGSPLIELSGLKPQLTNGGTGPTRSASAKASSL